KVPPSGEESAVAVAAVRCQADIAAGRQFSIAPFTSIFPGHHSDLGASMAVIPLVAAFLFAAAPSSPLRSNLPAPKNESDFLGRLKMGNQMEVQLGQL